MAQGTIKNKTVKDVQKSNEQSSLNKKKREQQEISKVESDERLKSWKKALDLQNKQKTKQDEDSLKLSNTISERIGKSIGASITSALSTATRLIGNSVNQYLGAYSNYFTTLTTRLLGSGKDYQSVVDKVQKGLGGTSSVSLMTVLQSLEKMVKAGIANNLEQRAFLDSVSNKIATTFDATNSTLLQITRLNRVDSTAAYLGIESALTEFFNGQFGDTNYLTSGLNESVSQSIYEATSQLGTQMGAEFEFAVQKWLGTFYESGVSGETIQRLAQGLGYLGSGNSNALVNDTVLNNLMAMAANNSGLDYANLLTNGITASDVERLMLGVRNQAVTMASSGDKVAQSQYASLFGMNLSDLTAMLSLSTENLATVADTIMDYTNLVNQTTNEVAQLGSRTAMKEKMQNVLDNVLSNIGDTIASSPGLYGVYTLADLIGPLNVYTPDLLGGISSIDVTGLMKGAIIGLSTFANLGTFFSDLGKTGTVNLSDFGESYSYGAGLVSSSATRGTVGYTSSDMTYVGTGDTSDLLNGTLSGSNNNATQVSSAIGADTTGKTTDDIFGALTDGDRSVIGLLSRIYDLMFGVTENGAVKVDVIKDDMDTITKLISEGSAL